MTKRKTGRGRKKLKLNRETVRDLDAKGKGKGVKAGWGPILPPLNCKQPAPPGPVPIPYPDTSGCPAPTGLCVTMTGACVC